MEEKFEKLLKELGRLNLPDGQYAIYGSGPMAIRGIREAKDLDIVVKKDLYKGLLERFKEIEPGHIEIDNIDIYSIDRALIDNPEEVIARAEVIKGARFICLEDLVAWKKKMGRRKDFDGIKLIQDYLKNTHNK